MDKRWVIAVLGVVGIAGLYAMFSNSATDTTGPTSPTPLEKAIAEAANSSEPSPDEPAAPSDYRLRVFHKHQFGNCDGTLIITGPRIRYVTRHTEDAFQFARNQLRLDDDGFIDPSGRSWHFSSPYGDVREVMRKWLGGSAQAQAFPADSPSNVPPFDSALGPAASRTLTVKHKHLFGSCDGTLRLSPNGISFEAADGKDSFTLAIDQARLDGDGVTGPTGKGWHFKSDGVNLEEILRAWKSSPR